MDGSREPSPRPAAASVDDLGKSLSAIQDSFARDGYYVFRDVVPKDALDAFHRRLSTAFEEEKRSGRLFDGGGQMTGHLNCSPREAARFAFEALERRGIVDVVRSLARTPLRHPYVGCNFNLPGSVAQHYHVDSAFMRGFMIANVAVVDTEIENGAIDLVTGTHQRFFKFWRFVVEAQRKHSTRIPMKQGDVLIRTSNLWHRGMPNFTSKPRPMLAYTWEDGGRDDDGFAADGGELSFHPNWFRPTTIGRLRERAFVHAPITYDAYRFVRSMIGNKGYFVA